MDWRTYSNGRRNRRNNRLDNRNRWIVAEEGQRSAKNTAIGHGLVQGFPLSGGIPEVKKNHGRRLTPQGKIKGKDRWCLWLVDVDPDEIEHSKFLRERVNEVRRFRETSKKTGDAYKLRHTPWLFRMTEYPIDSNLLVIPCTFGEAREYMTADWVNTNTVVTNLAYVVPDEDGLEFALIESRMFLVWLNKVGGHLETRNRFSNTVVWNNFPAPIFDDNTRQKLVEAGQLVLASRSNHQTSSLKTLYDPKYMPVDLRQAHEELDKIVDVAFGADKWLKDDDNARLKVLFDSYRKLA